MPEVAIVGLLIGFPLVGVLVRLWAAIVLPLVGWPLFYVGLNAGWWGHGTGDGWLLAALLLTAIGVASTAIVIAVARRLSSPLHQQRGAIS